MDMETNGSAIELALSNFQGIESAVLKFGGGLTCITGPNSSGKTSVFRALRAILLNPTTGKHYVRKGCKEARVALRIQGQPDVMWTRTRDSSTYKTSDSGTFEKAGRKRLHDYVSQYPLAVDESGRTLNIQSEWDVLFPFDRSSAEMFKLFENIFGIVDSAGILGTVSGDERTAKARLTVVTGRLSEIDTLQVRISETLSVCDEVRLLGLSERVGTIQRQLAEIEHAVEQVQFIDSVLSVKDKLIDSKVISFDVIDSAIQTAQDCHTIVCIDAILGYKDMLHRDITFDLNVIIHAKDMVTQCDQVIGMDRLLSYSILDTQSFNLTSFDSYYSTDDSISRVTQLDADRESIRLAVGVAVKEAEELSRQLQSVETCPLCGSTLSGLASI